MQKTILDSLCPTNTHHPARPAWDAPTIPTLAITWMLLYALPASANIALDRTRAIYTEADKAISITLTNHHAELPYLARAWIENDTGQPILSATTNPSAPPTFTLTPPIQRLEPKQKAVVKIQKRAISALPTDRESLFYFVVQEVPPKAQGENVLQIALRPKIKLFYRPAGIPAQPPHDPARDVQITLDTVQQQLILDNRSPYHISITSLTLATDQTTHPIEATMLPPKTQTTVTLPTKHRIPLTALNTVHLTHINDYGGQNTVTFQCRHHECTPQGDK